MPLVEEYKKLDPSSEEAERLSRIIAANIGDYASLRLVLGIDPPEFARFYPDMETANPTTMDTIDSFLDKFGTTIPPVGYAAQLEEESRKEEEENSPASLSDLLKERRYQEALELIEEQNLINPQKSIYFALQTRFLKKLIAIENFKNQTKG